MNIETVKMYSFMIKVGDARFAGQVPARSFEEVNVLVPSATEVGELIETLPVGQICSVCAENLRVIAPSAQPVDGEWQEEFE